MCVKHTLKGRHAIKKGQIVSIIYRKNRLKFFLLVARLVFSPRGPFRFSLGYAFLIINYWKSSVFVFDIGLCPASAKIHNSEILSYTLLHILPVVHQSIDRWYNWRCAVLTGTPTERSAQMQLYALKRLWVYQFTNSIIEPRHEILNNLTFWQV